MSDGDRSARHGALELERLRRLLTFVALTLAFLHLLFPDLEIDTTTVLLLVIAAVPWLQPLIKSIEILGLKMELQQLREGVDEVKGTAQSAVNQAQFAAARGRQEPNSELPVAGQDRLLALGREYENIRHTMQRGSARTSAMTAIFRGMADIAATLPGQDLGAGLATLEPGHRLAAYAHLFALPDFSYVEALVRSVTAIDERDDAFGQYWGLRALSEVLAVEAERSVSAKAQEALRRLLMRVAKDSDRYYELSRILISLEGRIVR